MGSIGDGLIECVGAVGRRVGVADLVANAQVMWLMWMTLALIAPRPAWCWATMEEQYVGDSPKTLDPDFNKLNEYLQADKENGVHMV